MNYILELLQEIRPDSNFQSGVNYVKEGLLDSIDIMALIAELEEQYIIKIRISDIIPENFQNIDTIVNLIRKSGRVI